MWQDYKVDWNRNSVCTKIGVGSSSNKSGVIEELVVLCTASHPTILNGASRTNKENDEQHDHLLHVWNATKGNDYFINTSMLTTKLNAVFHPSSLVCNKEMNKDESNEQVSNVDGSDNGDSQHSGDDSEDGGPADIPENMYILVPRTVVAP